MPERVPLIFKRERWFIAVFDFILLLVIPWCAWLTFYIFFFYHPVIHERHSDLVEARIVCLAALLFLCPQLFLTRIYVADIHLDDDGMGRWAWGRRWKYIRWADVKVITIKIIHAYNQRPSTMTSYCLYTTDNMTFRNAQKYGMRFDDSWPDAQALIAAVTQYVRQHNIKVLDKRGQTDRRPLSS
jgi:hypothetical protein